MSASFINHLVEKYEKEIPTEQSGPFSVFLLCRVYHLLNSSCLSLLAPGWLFGEFDFFCCRQMSEEDLSNCFR